MPKTFIEKKGLCQIPDLSKIRGKKEVSQQFKER